MSISYICAKCNFSTNLFKNLKKHINRKNLCSKKCNNNT